MTIKFLKVVLLAAVFAAATSRVEAAAPCPKPEPSCTATSKDAWDCEHCKPIGDGKEQCEIMALMGSRNKKGRCEYSALTGSVIQVRPIAAGRPRVK